MLLPERAVWPLPPRPLVLPWPPPSPQPTRFFRCTAPGTFFSSWSFMWFLRRRPGGAAARDSDLIKIFCDDRPKPARCAASVNLAHRRDVLRQPELHQAVQRRMHHGDVVRRTHRLGENVLHAGRFEDGAHSATSNEAGAG